MYGTIYHKDEPDEEMLASLRSELGPSDISLDTPARHQKRELESFQQDEKAMRGKLAEIQQARVDDVNSLKQRYRDRKIFITLIYTNSTFGPSVLFHLSKLSSG